MSELEKIYQEIFERVQREYRIEDAKNHAEDMEVDDLLYNIDYEIIVDNFLDDYDCNVDENSQFRRVISDYVERKKKSTGEKQDENEIKLIAEKPINYCDGKKVYYSEDVGAAREFAANINNNQKHMFSDSAEIFEVGLGAIITVTNPYDD